LKIVNGKIIKISTIPGVNIETNVIFDNFSLLTHQTHNNINGITGLLNFVNF